MAMHCRKKSYRHIKGVEHYIQQGYEIMAIRMQITGTTPAQSHGELQPDK